MSDYYEQDYVEPETAFTLKDGKAEVKIQFNATNMEKAAEAIIEEYVRLNFMPRINRAMDEYLKLNGYGALGDIIKKEVARVFIEKYPDIVENKANEIMEYIKNLKPESFRDWSWNGESISMAAKNKVKEYIENELENEVKVTKEWLEQFSRNYFANNLFRAMGMMDKILPQSVGEK
jgi:hypothetical protein